MWRSELRNCTNITDPEMKWFHRYQKCVFSRSPPSIPGLQTTRLGNHLEDRVNKFLRRQNHPEAGEVFVRVVASSDKTVEVKPGMKSRLVILIAINTMLIFYYDAFLHTYCKTVPIYTWILLQKCETWISRLWKVRKSSM